MLSSDGLCHLADRSTELTDKAHAMAKKAQAEPPKSKSEADPQNEPVNFEAAMEELEGIVATMEAGELSLDESLKAFERGVLLTRQCQSALQQAQLKVQMLTADGELEDIELEEFDDD